MIMILKYMRSDPRPPLSLLLLSSSSSQSSENLSSLDHWNAHELSIIVWSCATAGDRNGRPNVGMFEKVANDIAGLRSLASFASQSLSNVFWAYTTVNIELWANWIGFTRSVLLILRGLVRRNTRLSTPLLLDFL